MKPVIQLSWNIWFEINEQYVSEELCENKDKPVLECNGKCFLAKQIAATEEVQSEKSTKKEPSKSEKRNYQILKWDKVNSVIAVWNELDLLENQPTFHYSEISSKEKIKEFLHPPQLS